MVDKIITKPIARDFRRFKLLRRLPQRAAQLAMWRNLLCITITSNGRIGLNLLLNAMQTRSQS